MRSFPTISSQVTDTANRNRYLLFFFTLSSFFFFFDSHITCTLVLPRRLLLSVFIWDYEKVSKVIKDLKVKRLIEKA